MIKNKKTIFILLISLIMFYLIISIIFFVPIGKNYNRPIFIGSSTKVYIKDKKISIYNEDKKIRKQKTKIYFRDEFIDGYLVSDADSSTGVENNYFAHTDNGDLLSFNNCLIAHTKDISIKIKPNNRIDSSDLEDVYKFASSNSIILSSNVELSYLYINNIDIDDDGNDEYIYSVGLIDDEDEYKSFVFMKRDNKYILVAREESENSGVNSISLVFNNLIDFNNDDDYEFVVGKFMSEYGPDYYELYNFDGDEFTNIGGE